jgi:hypothetical protein
MYKEIKIEIEQETNIEQDKICRILDSFINDDFNFDIDENFLEIRLRTLDFNFFQINIQKYLTNGVLSQNSKVVIQKMLDAISSIGSYGIRGNKRVYVDFDKERKVQNRKEKVIKRQQFFYARDNNLALLN